MNTQLKKEHIERFFELLDRDETHRGDTERQALFFCAAAMLKTYQHIEKFYDFELKQVLFPEGVEEGEEFIEYIQSELPWSSGEKKLLQIGFNFFNPYSFKTDFLNAMSVLDSDNFSVAAAALQIWGGRLSLEDIEKLYNEDPEGRKK